MTVAAITLGFIAAAAAGYRTGYRAGRAVAPPHPRRPTYDVNAVRVLTTTAYDWETDD